MNRKWVILLGVWGLILGFYLQIMNRFPANEHNIKSLGIDFDNLTHSEIIDAIYKIDGAVYDSETNLIYTDIMDCFDDKKYFNLRLLFEPSIAT